MNQGTVWCTVRACVCVCVSLREALIFLKIISYKMYSLRFSRDTGTNRIFVHALIRPSAACFMGLLGNLWRNMGSPKSDGRSRQPAAQASAAPQPPGGVPAARGVGGTFLLSPGLNLTEGCYLPLLQRASCSTQSPSVYLSCWAPWRIAGAFLAC